MELLQRLGTASATSMLQVFNKGHFTSRAIYDGYYDGHAQQRALFDHLKPTIAQARIHYAPDKKAFHYHGWYLNVEDETAILWDGKGIFKLLNEWVENEMILDRWLSVPLEREDGSTCYINLSMTVGLGTPFVSMRAGVTSLNVELAVGIEVAEEELVRYFELQYRKAILDAAMEQAVTDVYLFQYDTTNPQVAQAARTGMQRAAHAYDRAGLTRALNIHLQRQG